MSGRTINRRILIQAAIAAPVLVGTVPGVESGDAVAVSETVQRLMRRRDELLAECDHLEVRWREIWPTLPDWSRSGPKYVNTNGEPFGERVGWPAASANIIRVNDNQWLVRPSPIDLRVLYEAEREELSPDTAGENYRTRIRQLRARLRRQRQCFGAWGLPTSSDWRPLDDEIESIERTLSKGKQVCASSLR